MEDRRPAYFFLAVWIVSVYKILQGGADPAVWSETAWEEFWIAVVTGIVVFAAILQVRNVRRTSDDEDADSAEENNTKS